MCGQNPERSSPLLTCIQIERKLPDAARRFALAKIGLDLQLGRPVGIGAQMDCLDEAVQLAATLSQPKPPFRVASRLAYDVDKYNAVASSSFGSRLAWDAGVGSEPIAILRILRGFDSLDDYSARCSFCSQNSITLEEMCKGSTTS